MTALIGLDVGPTSTRATAIDDRGRVISSAFAEYPVIVSRPGSAEQDPREWWRASREVLGRVAAEGSSNIAAIGLTGQMHGTVFLDQRRDVIRPALLAGDSRSAFQRGRIVERIGADRLLAITGNSATSSFPASKILWLRDVEPVQYRHVRHVLSPKDYVRFMLTGELATDVSDASATLLFDLRRRDWSAQILAALEIPREWLPPVRESAALSGRVMPAVASDLGLGADVRVGVGAGEHAAVAIANGITSEGCISSSIDARGVISASRNQVTVDRAGRLHAFCHAVPARYQLLAFTPAALSAVHWWREMVGGRRADDELIKLAETAPPRADGLLFHPSLASGGASSDDAGPRGAFVGLRAHHTAAHLTRAVMEGIVLGLRYQLDAMREAGAEVRTVRATGMSGGRGFWRRLQADVFNLPVQHTESDSSAAYGAALLAGVTAGVFPDADHAAALVKVSDLVNQPDPNRAQTYEAIYGRFRQLYRVLAAGASVPAG